MSERFAPDPSEHKAGHGMDRTPSQLQWRRGLHKIASHGLQRLLPVALGMALSVLVVRRGGAERWGQWVSVALVYQLAASVMAWGQRDFVLRALSRDRRPIQPCVIGHLTARARLLGLPTAVTMTAFGLWVGWPPWAVWLAPLWVALRTWSQSVEPVVFFEQRFVVAAMVEGVSGASAVLAAWWLGDGVDVNGLAVVLTGAELVRALGLAALFPVAWRRSSGEEPLEGSAWRTDRALLRASAPFFLLAAAGMLGSRVDLYCVSALASERDVARYQVWLSGMLWLQSVAPTLMNPFSRDIYEQPSAALLAWTWRFVAVGAVVAVAGALGMASLLERAYRLETSWVLVCLGAVYVFQVFARSPAVMLLYKVGREAAVTRVSLWILVLNGVLNVAMIPSLGIEGALLASVIVSVGAAISYWLMALRLTSMGSVE